MRRIFSDTVVEVIVVIAVLAILTVSAYMYLHSTEQRSFENDLKKELLRLQIKELKGRCGEK